MSVTTLSDLDGLTKIVYGDNLVNLIPETAKLSKQIPFSQAEKIGKRFDQPVVLTYEHGVSFGAPGAGAFSLNAAVPMKMQNAEVDAYQIVLRGQLDYESAAKAVAGGEKAFRKATQLQMENMMESGVKYLELGMLYGQSGLGQTSASVNSSATKTVVTIATATWASGIWAGMENQKIQFFKNSDGTLVSSGSDAIFVIESIDIDNKKLTVTGTATGIAALDTAIGAATQDIFWYGARDNSDTSIYNEMIGLNKIITNTSSTLFNISAATYVAWRGNTYSASSAALTLGKIFSALSAPIARGLNEKIVFFVSDRTWANLINDQAALRKYDSSYSTDSLKNGARSLTFYSANGEVEIQPYNCIKEGEAFGIPLKRCKRIGAQDFSFNSLGSDGKIFRELADNAGFEYRIYCSQQIFLESPARSIKLTGIVNS